MGPERAAPVSVRAGLQTSILLTSYLSPIRAQIQDNSFLLEEAYNQEAGVVQHINTFSRSNDGGWIYSFTQEWPLGGMRHQLSYTLPFLHSAEGGTGLADVALNYRYQLLGTPEAHTLVAPRFTLLFPTGSIRAMRGTGGLALQVNLPVTWVLSSSLVTHWNAGATLVLSAKDQVGAATTFSQNLGASLVWLIWPGFNALIESVWLNQEVLSGDGSTGRDEVVLLSPGVRAALNVGRVQIVPGLAYTVNWSGGENAVFLYLSFEHPFTHQ